MYIRVHRLGQSQRKGAKMRLGFIGTGRMGDPMARNLMRAGHELVVHDARPEATHDLLELGAQWADSPRLVAQACQVVLTSLPGPPEVETVALDEEGLLAGAAHGSTYIDLSTSSPHLIRRIAAAAAAQGVAVLDAPVSGGTIGAKEATLTVMVGGDRQVFERHLPLLNAIGRNVFHMGELGSGYIAKLINNMLSLTNTLAALEAMVLGAKAGLEPRKLWEAVRVSTGASRVLERMPQTVFNRRFEPTFTIELSCKDIGLALALGREHKVALRLAAVAEQVYIDCSARGMDDQPSAAIVRLLEEAAGVEIRD
ncbi:MAG: NAD(P)-dependent oxidoreductase [Dehalococcoidia bacterium]